MAGNPSAEKVSFEQLLISPRDYDQRLIEVVGRAELGFEDDQLFPLESVSGSGIRPPLWLDLPSPVAKLRCRFDGARVRVRARFEVGQSGHMGMNDAALTDIGMFQFVDAAEEKAAPTDCFLRVKAILADGDDPRAMIGNGLVELIVARGARLPAKCRVDKITSTSVSIAVEGQSTTVEHRVGEALKECF
jgi:hypothetical protein